MRFRKQTEAPHTAVDEVIESRCAITQVPGGGKLAHTLTRTCTHVHEGVDTHRSYSRGYEGRIAVPGKLRHIE